MGTPFAPAASRSNGSSWTPSKYLVPGYSIVPLLAIFKARNTGWLESKNPQNHIPKSITENWL